MVKIDHLGIISERGEISDDVHAFIFKDKKENTTSTLSMGIITEKNLIQILTQTLW